MFSYPAEWPVCYDDVECPDPGITTSTCKMLISNNKANI